MANTCRLCGGKTIQRFRKTVLGKYDVGFHECDQCLSLQTDEPFWLNESYADGRRTLDTRAVERAQTLQRTLYFLVRRLNFAKRPTLLDWGGR